MEQKRQNQWKETQAKIKNLNLIDEEKSENVKVILITPEIANDILDLNIMNREVGISNAGYIHYEMENNEFMFNGESIIISTEGLVLDGQHRLLGCIATKIQFLTVIVFNVDKEVMPTIDTGSSRTPVDLMKIVFPTEKNIQLKTTMVTKILNKFDKRCKRAGRGKANVKASPKEVVSFYRSKRELLNKIADFGDHLYRKSSDRLISSSDIAALVYLTGYEENRMPEFLYEFMTDYPMLANSNVAKKAVILFKEEKRKKEKGRVSFEPRILLNYLISLERIIYRRGFNEDVLAADVIRESVRHKKYSTASFPEYNQTETPNELNINFLDEVNILLTRKKTKKETT